MEIKGRVICMHYLGEEPKPPIGRDVFPKCINVPYLPWYKFDSITRKHLS